MNITNIAVYTLIGFLFCFLSGLGMALEDSKPIPNNSMVVCCLLISVLMFLSAGFYLWKAAQESCAIKYGIGHYEANPKTGLVTFIWNEKS